MFFSGARSSRPWALVSSFPTTNSPGNKHRAFSFTRSCEMSGALNKGSVKCSWKEGSAIDGRRSLRGKRGAFLKRSSYPRLCRKILPRESAFISGMQSVSEIQIPYPGRSVVRNRARPPKDGPSRTSVKIPTSPGGESAVIDGSAGAAREGGTPVFFPGPFAVGNGETSAQGWPERVLERK
jgi:hypothetical protein